MTRPVQVGRSVKAASSGQPSLLTLALAGALAAPHAWAADTPGSSSSTYTWSSTSPDVLVGNGINITVTTATALKAVSSTLGTLTNNGTLSNPLTGAALSPGISIFSGVHATLISNGASGSINGQYGILNAGTIVTLNNGGTITGALYAIENQGSIATLSNAQLIQGGSAGILNDSGHAIGTLSNSGTISSVSGVFNRGTIGALSNSGAIGNSSLGGQPGRPQFRHHRHPHQYGSADQRPVWTLRHTQPELGR